MPRIRTLKPELFQSPQVMNITLPARLLFIGLISQADDEGRGVADTRKLRAAIFPGDKFSPSQIAKWMKQLERQGLVKIYRADAHGELYALPTWNRHQKVEKRRTSAYPPPPTRALPDSSPTHPRGSDLILSEGSEGSLRACAREGRAARKTGEQRTEHIKRAIKAMPEATDDTIARTLHAVDPQPTATEIATIRNGGASQ